MSIYNRLRKVIFNNGSELNRNFIILLKYSDVKPTYTTINIPQENNILEIMQQVVNSMINTKYLSKVTFDAVSPLGDILASITYAVQCPYHITLQATPIQLFYKFPTDLQGDVAKEEKLVISNNKRENAKQVQYDFEVSHYAYIIREGNYRRLEGYKLELFRITQVHTNGSV